MKEEDQVVYLLASLPESYSVLVTALEASADVPSLAVVTERLLHRNKDEKPSKSVQSGRCPDCQVEEDTEMSLLQQAWTLQERL